MTRTAEERALLVIMRLRLLLPALALLAPRCGDGCAPCLCCAPACPRSWGAPPILECCTPIPACPPQAPPQALRLGAPHASRPRVEPLLDLNAGNFQGAWGTHAELSQVAGRYHQLGVKQLRTHDYSEALDIAHIYPDLSQDPATSMNFTLADEAFANIVDNGFTPFLRLGNSGGQQPGASWVPDVWGAPNSTDQIANIVEAMVRIVGRYTNRSLWALPSTHVEVWNEPNEPGFWNPSPKACVHGCTSTDNMTKHWPLFVDMFSQAVTALKASFPAVKVGGPGLGLESYCTPDPATGRMRVGGQGVELQPFVDKLVRDKVPLDFISWHRYANYPARISECAQEVRAMLPPAWEMYVTEWNLGVAGPFNSTAAASMATAMWIGLQDTADKSFLYWGCCAAFPYTASGLGAAGDGLALFAANDSLPWKPQALAFAMWHNASLHAQRRTVTVSGDSMTPLVALAGESSAGELAILVANPQNRSVSFSLSSTDEQPLCSAAAPCAIAQIQDTSGQVAASSSTGGNVSIAAWGTMTITTKHRDTSDSDAGARIKTEDRQAARGGYTLAFGKPSLLGQSNASQPGGTRFWYPSISIATNRSTAGRGHVAQHVTLANDGGPCDDPRPGAEGTQNCEAIFITRDGGSSWSLAKNVSHGTSGTMNGYGDLGTPVPSAGLPAGTFRTMVSCFHSQTMSSDGWVYTCSGGPRVVTANPFHLLTWEDAGGKLRVIGNRSVYFGGTPAAFLNSTACKESIYNCLTGPSGKIVRLADGSLISALYGKANDSPNTCAPDVPKTEHHCCEPFHPCIVGSTKG